jgi:uncharacterized membrane protein YedE/YeeE
MPMLIAGLVCGVIFGVGLVISGMTQPSKVLGFLDLFGRWDPTLAIVMAAALAVAYPGYVLARRRAKPFCAAQSLWPTNTTIDRRLIVGSGLFGVGWGLVGLCPGPALVNLTSFSPHVFVFVIAMAAGMVAKDFWGRLAAAAPAAPLALASANDG